MKNWRKTCVHPSDTLRDVITTIDEAELQIALVVSEKKLLGVITDGDIRRALIRGLDLSAKALDVMTSSPTVAHNKMSATAIELLMEERDLRHIPIVDKDGILLDLALKGQVLPQRLYDNQIFLMAGGLGSRLGDLTKDIPKPLIKVGDRPILETIVKSFLAQGFYRFTMTLNYKSEQIRAHFEDGRQWGAEISYIHEKERLGTCGALSLIKEKPAEPVFVMNGDLLTRLDFAKMLEFHDTNPQMATMAVREYDVQIPFGVIETEGHTVLRLKEKPVERYYVNAGIYILDPQCLELIPYNQYCDITSLFQALLDQDAKVANYPIHEYWIDIGRVSDLERAKQDYFKHWSPESVY